MAAAATAQDYALEKLQATAAVDAVAPEIASALRDQGMRVKRGTRTLCDIWLCKAWEVASVEPPAGRLYPFQPAQLLGVLHFPRDGEDFRQQDIEKGWYTLRYELQPTDGNHVGTFPSPDFVLLVRAANDRSTAAMETKMLIEAAQDAAGTSHPAMLALQPVAGQDTASPSLRHDQQHDWWVLQVEGTASVDGKPLKLTVALVVAGYVQE